MKKTVPLVFICWLSLITGCTSNGKTERKELDNLIVEAHFDNDTTIDGVAKYYDHSNRLASLVNYNHGVKYGPSVNYYPSGIIRDSMLFFDNKKHGEAYHYDSLGRVSWSDYQFYGIKVGPSVFYKKGEIDKYLFTDFNKNDLLIVEYDSNGSVRNLSALSTKATVTRVIENGNPMLELFLYLPNPPFLNIYYEFGLTDATRRLIPISQIPKNDFFYDTLLPYPKSNLYYYVSAHVKGKDSVINKVFIEDLPDW